MIKCLVFRAVHIEILEEMTSSRFEFINALRRFCAIRDGEVDPVGLRNELRRISQGLKRKCDQYRPIKDYLLDNRINWIFNPYHSSHMGGVWERMIGVTRWILD